MKFEAEFVGVIFLRVRTDEVQASIRRTMLVTVWGFVVGVVIAMLLSYLLQRVLTQPLLRLSDAMQTVTRDRDYSIRVAKPGDDEIGILSDGFNGMLAELELHTTHLEDLVRDRTESLQRKSAELGRSNSELEQFAYIASHDLQEPLRKVQAFGDMLTTQFQAVLGTEGQDYLQRMQNAAKRMQGLINDLLNFSRVMTKAKPFVSVDLKSVAQQVVGDLESRIQQTGGRVEIGDLPSLEADPLQMQQLLQNLIGNGLKYHRPEVAPVVSVQAKLVNSNHGLPGAPPSQPICEITVTDNGIGFEEKYAERIFAPFERLHGREFEGTGMGLAICRKIVERHGGIITAQGIVNQGAVFVAKLPVKHSEGGAS